MTGFVVAVYLLVLVGSVVYLVWFVTSINDMRESLKVIAKHVDPAGFKAIGTLPVQPDPETCGTVFDVMGPKGEMTFSQLVSATGLSGDDVAAALRQLAQAGHVEKADEAGTTWRRT